VGKGWLIIDDKGFHDCTRKDRLELLKSKTGGR
jgi:hypothetical protein